jgi:hypothetical protein
MQLKQLGADRLLISLRSSGGTSWIGSFKGNGLIKAALTHGHLFPVVLQLRDVFFLEHVKMMLSSNVACHFASTSREDMMLLMLLQF